MANSTPTDFEALQAPFPKEVILQRAGAYGKTYDYIGVRTTMDRLDRVLGPGNWSTEYRDWYREGIICRAGVRVVELVEATQNKFTLRVEWVYKENLGVRSDIEPEKGGITAAFRRVWMNEWGVGRELYQEPSETEKPEPEEERVSYAEAHRLLRWDIKTTKLAVGVEHFTEYFGDGQDYMLKGDFEFLQLIDRFIEHSVGKGKDYTEIGAYLGKQGKSYLAELEPAEIERYV